MIKLRTIAWAGLLFFMVILLIFMGLIVYLITDQPHPQTWSGPMPSTIHHGKVWICPFCHTVVRGTNIEMCPNCGRSVR